MANKFTSYEPAPASTHTWVPLQEVAFWPTAHDTSGLPIRFHVQRSLASGGAPWIRGAGQDIEVDVAHLPGCPPMDASGKYVTAHKHHRLSAILGVPISNVETRTSMDSDNLSEDD